MFASWPRRRSMTLLALSFLVIAFTIAACAPKPPPPAAAKQFSELAQQGREVYLNKANPPCGICHVLADAGSVGSIGTNLDTLKPDAATVKKAVVEGISTMPSQANLLTPEEIDAVAAYVEEATR